MEEISSCIVFLIFLNRNVLYCITDDYVDENSRDGDNGYDDEAENGDYDESDENSSNSNSHSKVGYIAY